MVKAEATPVVSATQESTEQVNGSQETRDIKGVTVVTRVEEKSTFDVSRILADKDALHAELLILRSILSTKEKELEVGIILIVHDVMLRFPNTCFCFSGNTFLRCSYAVYPLFYMLFHVLHTNIASHCRLYIIASFYCIHCAYGVSMSCE